MTSNYSVFEAFLINLIDLLVENANLFESKKINYSHKKFFDITTIKKKPKYYFLELVIIINWKKQQSNKFYDYSQF